MRVPCTTIAIGLLTVPAALAQQSLSFDPGYALSDEALPGAAVPGGAASKGKLVRLFKTAAGARDGRLVTLFADANGGDVWEPKGGQHPARDIFTRWSDDNGRTWSEPVNLSNTAQTWSAMSDWDGSGTPQPYWGDSGKANVFSSGDVIVVSWVDKYAPEAGMTWGTAATSAIQGRIKYPDLAIYPEQHEVPFAAVYAAVSKDGGTTWLHGGATPPLQLTYGRRDAKQHVNKGSGKRWVMTWQEDPAGLQTGEGDGPGEGSSGAKVTQGTDIWYTWATDVSVSPTDLRANRTPLTNQSEYDTTGTNGYPLVVKGGSSGHQVPGAGDLENHGCSRANLTLVKQGSAFKAIVAYEETKGIPEVHDGKTVQYHAFPYEAPVQNGTAAERSGDAGVKLTTDLRNSRRTRFLTQPVDGVHPAIAIFWKEGLNAQGAPADIMLKVSKSVDPADVLAAPAVNLSTNTPNATMADLVKDSEFDPIENALAHRGLLRGDMLILGWSYTWNGPLARYTDLANYDFWMRRSLDGGLTWLAPVNLTNLPETKVSIKEPRIVGVPKTGTHDDNSFVVAWGIETNVYEGIGFSEPVDIGFTHTHDQGATFAPPVMMAGTQWAEFESQLRPDEDVSNVYGVWMDERDSGTDVKFAAGVQRGPVWVEVHNQPALLGELNPLTFHAEGFEGEKYIATVSLGFHPGTDMGFGWVPLNDGLLFQSAPWLTNVFVNFWGVFGITGTSPAGIALPNAPALAGFEFYVALLAVREAPLEFAVSQAVLFEIEK